MSKPLKPKRGTTAQHASFAGEPYEITVDTDKKTVVVHDGETAGGTPLAKEGSVSALENTLRTLIQQELAQKLSTSGGAMTGPLTNTGTQHEAIIFRLPTSKDAPGDGAIKDLIFQDSDGVRLGLLRGELNKNGSFSLSLSIPPENSYDGNWYSLTVASYGKIMADGHPILTSAGGEVAGSLSFYPRGRTFSYGNEFSLAADGEGKVGAVFRLFSIDDDGFPGGFALIVRNADGTWGSQLRASPTHGLNWNNSPVLTLVASWDDGAGNWYRKYNDGWIEQGGRSNAIGDSATTTFHTAFSDANYTAVITPQYSSSDHRFNWAVIERTSTSMKIYSIDGAGATSRPCDWYACGY